MRDAVEREMRAAASYCAHLLAGLPRPVLILDADRRIVYANGATRSLRERRRDSLVGFKSDDEVIFGRGVATKQADEAWRPIDPSPPDAPTRAIATGEPVFGQHLIVEHPRAGRLYFSVDAVPLRTEVGTLAGVGVIYTDDTEEVARRTEGEWLRQELVASRRQLEEVLRLSEALNSIGDAIHSTLDFDELLRRMVKEATEAIGATAGMIELRHGTSWVAHVVEGLPSDLLSRVSTLADAPYATLVAKTGEPLAVRDAQAEDSEERGLARELGTRGMIVVPLLFREDVTGVLSFHFSTPMAFSRTQLDFASKVATTTSLAVENARVYGAERHIADTLQTALLAVPAQLEGVEFAQLYRSATEAAWVGGDFFDLFELPGSRIGIVIGDVSGKGVEASALASFTRQLLKAHAHDEESPARALARTNDLVTRVSRPEEFVTVFFGVLSPGDGTLTFCNAGHPPPIIADASGAALLEDGGPMIGAWEDMEYDDHVTTLEESDVFVLYTDGVIEAKRDGELFGDERLLDLVAAAPDRPVSEFPATIVDEVTRYAKGRLRDDVAVLCLRRTR